MNGWKDYPSGDGRPGCPECHGRGVVPLPKELRPKFTVGPITQVCRCVLARDIMANLERGWRGLSKAAPIKGSPLRGHEGDNLLVTAAAKDIKEHVRHVAARMGPRWGFQVVSDAALMDAWLSKGLAKVYDADVEEARAADARKPAPEKSPYEALSEIVEPAALLIVILGVKSARNSAMPEVLLEALTLRDFAGRPTWLVDQPVAPFCEGHLSWSLAVSSWIDSWDRIALSRLAVASATPPRAGADGSGHWTAQFPNRTPPTPSVKPPDETPSDETPDESSDDIGRKNLADMLRNQKEKEQEAKYGKKRKKRKGAPE